MLEPLSSAASPPEISAAMPWFRVYRSDVHDQTLQELPLEAFKFAINLRCLADHMTGRLPELSRVAYALRLTLTRSRRHADLLLTRGWLHERDGALFIADWRQRESDNEGRRKQKQRLSAKSRAECPGTKPETCRGTGPDNVPQEIEIEETDKTHTRLSACIPTSGLSDDEALPSRKRAALRRCRLDSDAIPTAADLRAAGAAGLTDIEIKHEWAHFRDHHVAKGSLMADWSAAWRSWLGNRDRWGHRGNAAPRREREDSFVAAAKSLLREMEGPGVDASWLRNGFSPPDDQLRVVNGAEHDLSPLSLIN